MLIGICGHYSNASVALNGQTVKTKIVTQELCRHAGQDRVRCIDTHGGVKMLLKLPFQLWRMLAWCTDMVILPAQNGLRVITPILSLLNVFYRRGLHYAVIGGWLPEFLEDKKVLSRQLKKFKGVYVETEAMKKALEKQGFANVFVMPNCKQLDILTPEQLTQPRKPYKLCTFSRVMKEKGIEDAVEAVKRINEAAGETLVTLDIYGQVDQQQTQWFEQLRSQFPAYVRYGGLVPFDKSVEVLKDYFALLFPTYYEGEGFAGTLLDALASGTPVIASDWRYNPELVKQGRTGVLFPAGDVDALVGRLREALDDVSGWNAMRPLCLQEAHSYQPEEVLRVLLSQMEG